MTLAQYDDGTHPTGGDDALQTAVSLARRISGSRRASLMATGEHGEELRIVASSGIPAMIVARARVRLGDPVAGIVAQTCRPLLINERRPRGRRAGYRTDSFMSVPIQLRDTTYGVLSVADPVMGEEFDESDLAALQQFGAYLTRDISLDATRLRLRRLQRQVRALHGRVIEAREEERSRIGRELHDETGDTLTKSLLSLDLEMARLPAGDAATRAILQRVREGLRESAGALHTAALALRPSVLQDLGLAAALRSLAEESPTVGLCAVTVAIDDGARPLGGGGHPLGEVVELALYRIAQEALTNVRKHARAKHAWIRLLVYPRWAILTIEDNGAGLDTPETSGHSRLRGRRLGLTGMRERAEALGGTLEIGQREGGGTRVALKVPLRPAGDGKRDDRR